MSPASSRRDVPMVVIVWVCEAFWGPVALFQQVDEVLSKT